MGDFTGTTIVDADTQALFDFLSQVDNLPDYFSRVTSARPGEGEEVQVSAQTPDGTRVGGDAWFRVDEETQSIAWGSEGPNDYHGRLQVTGTGGRTQVEVAVHTTRVADGDQAVQDAIAETLATIRRLVEEQDTTAALR